MFIPNKYCFTRIKVLTQGLCLLPLISTFIFRNKNNKTILFKTEQILDHLINVYKDV